MTIIRTLLQRNNTRTSTPPTNPRPTQGMPTTGTAPTLSRDNLIRILQALLAQLNRANPTPSNPNLPNANWGESLNPNASSPSLSVRKAPPTLDQVLTPTMFLVNGSANTNEMLAFKGRRSDYFISITTEGNVTVQSIPPRQGNLGERYELSGVEQLRFADGVADVEQLRVPLLAMLANAYREM